MGVGCHSLLQGIFPTQGSNLHLLHCSRFYHWATIIVMLCHFQVYNTMIQPFCRFSSVQLLSCVRLFATPWIAACQASLSITNSRSSLKLTSIESVMPFSHLILCRPLLLLPPVPPSIRVFSNESPLCMRWPKYWSFSFSIIPSKEHPCTHANIQIAEMYILLNSISYNTNFFRTRD